MTLRSLVRLPKAGAADRAIIFVRIVIGNVFIAEGIQKFLFPDALGVGRFIKIGIPAPDVMAPFVGVVEIIFGLLVLLGLFTRLASIPLIIDMLTAIATTKIPFLSEHGFWAAAHESRVDISMLLCLIFLLLAGPGKWSLDRKMAGDDTKSSKSAL